jgi:hypothetical protein
MIKEMTINWNVIGLIHNENLIKEQLEILDDYYENFNLFVKNKKDQLIDRNNKLQEKLKKESEEIREQYDDDYAEELYLIEKMEQTFYFSVIMSIYTLIEHYLKKICNHIIFHKNYTKIEKVKEAIEYLKNYCGINFADKDLEFLYGIKAIRNVLVHNNGKLDSTSKYNIREISNISQKALGCKIKNQNIELETIFVKYCLEQIGIIFKNIFRQILIKK